MRFDLDRSQPVSPGGGGSSSKPRPPSAHRARAAAPPEFATEEALGAPFLVRSRPV